MASGKAGAKRAETAARSVEFTVRAPEAGEVIVTGDFTGWSEEGILLTRAADGDWKTTLKFLPGEYQYRIRVDGRWRDHADAKKRVPNPFGSENCVLTVS